MSTSLDAWLPWLISVMLLSVRLTVALVLSPALSSYGVPSALRVVLVLALAVLAIAARGPVSIPPSWTADPLQLAAPVLAEVFMGALLGLGAHVVLAAFALAGRLLDVQIGFAIGSLFDPVARSSANVLGSMTSLVGVTLFFVCDAHLALAHMVARSTEVFPLGELPPLDAPLGSLLAAGSMFTLGLALAAPTAMALVLTDLVVGVASRNLPQVNVLVLAMPAKVIVGYFVLALSVIAWAPLTRQGFAAMADALGSR